MTGLHPPQQPPLPQAGIGEQGALPQGVSGAPLLIAAAEIRLVKLWLLHSLQVGVSSLMRTRSSMRAPHCWHSYS